MAASRFVTVKNLGRMSYGPAIAKMKETCEKKVAYRKRVACSEPMDIIYIVEHPPVYTIGTRTQLYLGPSTTDFERTDEKLKKFGAEFYKTNRGGLITFHGPGQLVCYPVLNLRNFKPSARWYINRLEQIVIDTCADFKINVGRTADIGVWTEDRKIAAIGVHVSKYITSHGLALNCNTDLSWFDHIVPCGIQGKSVTSLSKELNTDIKIEDVVPILLKKFQNLFNCQLIMSE